MPVVKARQSTRCLTLRIRKLPNGRYEGYITYRVDGAADGAPESYVAGDFDSDHQAHMAASRLLETFRAAVVAPAAYAGHGSQN